MIWYQNDSNAGDAGQHALTIWAPETQDERRKTRELNAPHDAQIAATETSRGVGRGREYAHGFNAPELWLV
ncbi:MAG: hypothetical protein ACK4IT_00315 [Thioalkalivibrionaceae bacterium]